MRDRTKRTGLMAGTLLLLADAAWAKGGNPAGGLAFFIMVGTGITAFMVWGRATFPHITQRADKVLRDSSAWKTFWVGLVNTVVALLLFVFLAKFAEVVKPAAVAALLVAAGAAVTAFRGGLALWPAYGHRILGADDAPTDLQATVAGGALLTGILLLFPVGLVFFTYVLVRSLGAGVLMCVSEQPKSAPMESPSPQ